MMRVGRRAPLLVAFCLLASAATASAECAWVLWWHDIAPVEVWDISQAHPNLKECTDDLVDTARSMKADGYRISGLISGSRMITLEKGSRRGYALCLPDTMDPRGPKSK
jgi:hypothetical protein